jgi:hypothetical protein
LFSLGPDLNVIHKSLRSAAEYRKRSDVISHTIAWTMQLESSIRRYLYEDDVDAIIVEPSALKESVQLISKSNWLQFK